MNKIKKLSSFKKSTISKCVAFSLLMIASSQASALNINLCAGEITKKMPDGAIVKVWGYGLDDASAGCSTAKVPGPQLDVPVGDTDLNITLRNTLSESVSVIIPGMKATSENAPVHFTDGQGRQRVRSFATETGTGLTTTYSFDAKAGTFLYQSGTHAAVQVQMGLYGATTHDAAIGQAYPGVAYDKDVVMLYSEIDPAMHDSIAGTADGLTPADYGTTGPTSTIGYKARYFLVNGVPFDAAAAKLNIGNKGDRVLLRFLNAGLESHVPVLQGQHMNVIAEYGHAYPFARQQYSILLAAGATKDAIFSPKFSGDYPLYDRRLRLTNGAASGAAGLMSIMQVNSVAVINPAIAENDTVTTAEDTSTTINVHVNDTNADPASCDIAAQPTNGSAVVNAGTNDVTYTPNANYNGTDSFSYTVRNATGDVSNVATVSVNVTAVNDAPIATDDSYDVAVGSVTNLSVLTNDSDVDLDSLTPTVITAPTLGSLVAKIDGSFDYSAGAVIGNDSFTYNVTDGILSATATVNISVSAVVNYAPVAEDDYVTVTKNKGTLLNSVEVAVSSNDSDSDGLDLTSVTISTNPNSGTVVVNATGTITYTPKAGFRGSDAFSYTINDSLGKTSNIATVRVDVLKP